MSNHVYSKVELTGSSQTSIEDAVQQAIDKLAATVQTIRWFEVVETRGHVESNKISHWQVTVKIGYTL